MLRNCILLVIVATLFMFLIKKWNERTWVTNLGSGRYVIRDRSGYGNHGLLQGFSKRKRGETPDVSWCSFKGKIIGRPKATLAYSVEKLEKMDMVSLYARKRFYPDILRLKKLFCNQ